MINTLILCSILGTQGAAPAQDAWELKAPYTKGKEVSYKLVTDANVGGEQHTAKMDLVFTPGEPNADGTSKAKYAWQKLELDGEDRDMPMEWQTTVGAEGILRECIDPQDDDYRRFLSIYGFAYPEKPVKVGDKWSVEVTPKASGAKNMKYDFEAKEVVKLNDQDALKIVSQQREAGDNGIKNDGTWWLAKNGSILKFQLVVKNWIVPFSGAPEMSATIDGVRK